MLSPRAIAMQGVGYSPRLIALHGFALEPVVGRRRRTRVIYPPVQELQQEAAEALHAPVLTLPSTSLVPDANHIVVATATQAKRVRRSAEWKRRLAIQVADDIAITRLMTQINEEDALDALLFDWF